METIIQQAPIWIDKQSSFNPAYTIDHLSKALAYPFSFFPDKKAITDGTIMYTFSQLESVSNYLALDMLSKGITSGDRIIVLSEKYCEVVIACFAIWKIGAIYVPIDPESYFKRKSFFDDTLEPKAFIGNNTLLDKTDKIKFSFDHIRSFQHAPFKDQLELPEINDSNAIAYIIHTSGSTGTPKGVCIQHEKVIDYFYNHNTVLQFHEGSYCFSISPFHFDVSIEDTILPVTTGASVYIFRGLPMASIMLNILEKEKITHLIAVSTILTLMTSNLSKLQNANLSCLEMVMTGAEVCDVDVINTWIKKLPHARIINAYGPTEVTIVCLTHTIRTAEENRKMTYPIGVPLPNNSAILLAEDNSIIEENETEGELLIGGNQLMKGYWRNETETNKVFQLLKQKLYYKTGDICYRNKDGQYVFVGRRDNEVKINGRRINLGEVKVSLLNHDKIINAATGIADFGDKKKLIAVICLQETDIQSTDFLKIIEEIRIMQPAYLLPEIIGFSNNPILGSSGKINEKQNIALLTDAINKNKNNSTFFFQTGIFIPTK